MDPGQDGSYLSQCQQWGPCGHLKSAWSVNLRRPLGLVKESNKSQWEKKQPESQGVSPSEREGGDLGPEITKWVTIITETKERETNKAEG